MPKTQRNENRGEQLHSSLQSRVLIDVRSRAAFHREGETMSEEGAMRL